jgi:hypothetical protein
LSNWGFRKCHIPWELRAGEHDRQKGGQVPAALQALLGPFCKQPQDDGFELLHGDWRPMLPATLQFLIAMIACVINAPMQRKLDYTQEEVRVLKELRAALTGNGRMSLPDPRSGPAVLEGVHRDSQSRGREEREQLLSPEGRLSLGDRFPDSKVFPAPSRQAAEHRGA